MLYDEAVRQCDRALDLLDKDIRKHPGNIEKTNAALTKVQDIITELMASLDFDAGGEIARDLFSLYVFFKKELMDANMAKDHSRIRSVRGMLDELRSAWTTIAAQAPGAGTENRSGVNIAG
jgi:flagellar protein FliS